MAPPSQHRARWIALSQHRARRIATKRLGIVAAALVAAVVVAGCTSSSRVFTPQANFEIVAPPAPEPPTTKGTVLDLLGTLQIRTDQGDPGFASDSFDTTYLTVAGSKCNALNFVLERDLTNVLAKAKHVCEVVSGALFDPYAAKWLWYETQPPNNLVSLDYVVALADAWASGASTWSADQRHKFANDPDELLAVATADLGLKGQSDASLWLPPETSDQCSYVAQQIKVKAEFLLTVTQAEHDAFAAVLANCPDSFNAPTPTTPAPPPPPGAPTISPSAAVTTASANPTHSKSTTPLVRPTPSRSPSHAITPTATHGPTPTVTPTPPASTPPRTFTYHPPPPTATTNAKRQHSTPANRHHLTPAQRHPDRHPTVSAERYPRPHRLKRRPSRRRRLRAAPRVAGRAGVRAASLRPHRVVAVAESSAYRSSAASDGRAVSRGGSPSAAGRPR